MAVGDGGVDDARRESPHTVVGQMSGDRWQRNHTRDAGDAPDLDTDIGVVGADTRSSGR